MRCASCAVCVGVDGVVATGHQCGACKCPLCETCAEGATLPFRCTYCHSIAADAEVILCTKNFRALGKNCMGHHVEFAQTLDDGSTRWARGTLLVR